MVVGEKVEGRGERMRGADAGDKAGKVVKRSDGGLEGGESADASWNWRRTLSLPPCPRRRSGLTWGSQDTRSYKSSQKIPCSPRSACFVEMAYAWMRPANRAWSMSGPRLILFRRSGAPSTSTHP